MNSLCQIELEFFDVDQRTLQTKINQLLKHAEIQIFFLQKHINLMCENEEFSLFK